MSGCASRVEQWLPPTCLPGQGGRSDRTMRSIVATKREVNVVKKLLFLMSAEQAGTFERLVEAANRGDGGAACRLGDMCREGLGGLRYSPKETFRWYARSAMAGDAK